MDFWINFWRYFWKDKLGLLGAAGLMVMVLSALLAPVIAPYDYNEQDITNRLEPPSSEHILGTDGYGRDVLTRVMWGGRVSLRIGFFGAAITVLIGTAVGAVSGYFGGPLDLLLMRVTEAVMSIPVLFLVLVIVAVAGASTELTMLVIGLVYWPGTARLVRGEFLQTKEEVFVEASRSVGATHRRIIIRHILPNVVPTIVVQSSLLIAEAILLAAGLSYLGLGAQPPIPSWGNMLTEGRRFVDLAWWIATFPGAAIFVTVLGFNLVGDTLRGALDPYQRHAR